MAERIKLPADQEKKFQAWYSRWADLAGIDPNPDAPEQRYDYRGAYLAGVTPEASPEDNYRLHWPSEFKDDDHPNRYVTDADKNPGTLVGGGMLDSKTGKPVSVNRQPEIQRQKLRARVEENR